MVVNEIGKIDVDGAVVAAGSTAASVLLSNGCVCCSMGNDLLDTIERLQDERLAAGREPFGRIIVECSGLSRPGPIIRSLRRLPVRQLNIRIVTAFHSAQGRHQLAEHEEVAAQLAAAHAVVLTHADTITATERQAVAALLRHTSPLAELIDAGHPEENARQAFTATPRPETDDLMALDESVPPSLQLGHRSVKTFLVHLRPDLSWEQISLWLDDIASFCGNRLLRLKGFVQPSDFPAPVLVQSVGTVFSAPRPMRPAASHQRGLVLIGRGLSPVDLQEVDSDMVATVRVWGAMANLGDLLCRHEGSKAQ